MPSFRQLLLGSLFLTATAATIQIPPPSGPYDVQITHTKLVDSSRVDPFSDDGSKRAIMVSSFAPMECHGTEYIPYMPDAVAAVQDAFFASAGIDNGTFESVEIANCTPEGAHPKGDAVFPLMIFSPSLGAPRLLYSAMLQAIASTGHVVVSVDHPHDANAVEFPDGTVIRGEPRAIKSNPSLRVKDFDARVQDLGFVLDQLQQENQHIVPRSLSGKINFEKVTATGHSYGGATAAQAMLAFPRFAGGINLDGIMFGPVVSKGFTSPRPFLEFESGTNSKQRDSTWAEFLGALVGWKRELKLDGSAHDSFTDLPILIDLLHDAKAVRAQAQELVGTIPGQRVREILKAYLGAAVEYYATGTESSLLKGPSEKYPEVEFELQQ